MSRRFGRVLVLAISMVAITACNAEGGSDHQTGTGGSHGGSDHQTGSGGKYGGVRGSTVSDGSAGVAVPVITCGSATCPASATFSACCVDATRNTCGVEDKVVGISCGVPAIADPTCPSVSVDFAGKPIVFQGCCTESGACGGFNLGSPCAVVPVVDDEDAGAVRLTRRACRRTD